MNSLELESPVNGFVYAKISVTKNADTIGENVLVIAVYDKNNVLADMTTMQSEYLKGQTVKFRGRIKYEEGCIVKAFVWDSLESMKPLCDAKEIEL